MRKQELVQRVRDAAARFDKSGQGAEEAFNLLSLVERFEVVEFDNEKLSYYTARTVNAPQKPDRQISRSRKAVIPRFMLLGLIIGGFIASLSFVVDEAKKQN